MTYLDPPPLPAPVVVTKDFGGLVTEYQARTEEYRAENREIRVHECHSACTMVLSLPNACVYPDSIFKFHQAYNLRNHLTDYSVSAELFNTYPDAVRARLGTLTREFKILKGSELIQLGIRDCNERRIMVASAGKVVQKPLDQSVSLTSMVHGWMGSLTGSTASQPAAPQSESMRVASREIPKSTPSEVVFTNSPLPPPRPAALVNGAPDKDQAPAAPENTPTAGTPADVPLPPERPPSLNLAYTKRLPVVARLRLIGGATPILSSTTFVAFNAMPR